MNVTIKTIPHKRHRYDTLGDYWWTPSGNLEVRTTDTGDWRMDMLIAVHELIESLLCEARGIKEPDIMAFDTAVPDDSPYADDPGHDPAAPYHREHVFAECVERLFAQQLGVNWKQYEARLEEIDECASS